MLDTKLPTAKIYVQGKKSVNFSKVLNFRDVPIALDDQTII